MEFKSKVDKWYYGAIIFFAVFPVLFALYFIVSDSFLSLTAVVAVLIALCFLAVDALYLFPVTRADYIFDNEKFTFRYGFFVNTQIPYASMKSVKKVRDFVAASATSLERVEIVYYDNDGKINNLQISPTEQERFIKTLNKYILEKTE